MNISSVKYTLLAGPEHRGRCDPHRQPRSRRVGNDPLEWLCTVSSSFLPGVPKGQLGRNQRA